MKNLFLRSAAAFATAIVLSQSSYSQTAPQFTISEPVTLFEETVTKEAGLAINTQEPEVLFVSIDTVAIDDDPLTGEPAVQAVFGFFYNPETLQPTRDPFIIVGNPRGNLRRMTVAYNAFSNQYFVGVTAENYSPNGSRIPLMAIINTNSAAGAGDPVVKRWAWNEESTFHYDDTAVAASSKNGNLIFISERNFDGESGEGVQALLYDKDGNLLTNGETKLDMLEADRDEDDPDVLYLPENDVFMFITNIDPSTSANRISASIIQPSPDTSGNLQVGNQQVVSQLRKNISAGHPSAIENPFNKEFIGGLDYGNGADGGDLFYFNIGPAPDYVFSEARPQIPYLDATGNNPYSHRHPRFAVDRNSGVIVVSINARDGNFQGMAFLLLGPDGAILPGQPADLNKLVETETPVSNDANFHDVQYDPRSDSFLVIYATQAGFTNVVRLKVTSNHAPASVADWMLN